MAYNNSHPLIYESAKHTITTFLVLTYLVQTEIPEDVSSVVGNVERPIVHAKFTLLTSVHPAQIPDEAPAIEQGKFNKSIGLRQVSYSDSHGCHLRY